MGYIVKMISENSMFRSIYFFLMGDVYPLMEYYIIAFFKYYNYLKEYRQPLAILDVNVNKNTDITQKYINNENWEESFQKDDIVHVTWRHYDEIYKMCFTVQEQIPFPPYSLQSLNTPITKKIIAMTVTDSSDDDYDTLKQYAGPKHNFYCDVGGKMNVKWIINKDGDLDVIDSCGGFKKIDGKEIIV